MLLLEPDRPENLRGGLIIFYTLTIGDQGKPETQKAHDDNVIKPMSTAGISVKRNDLSSASPYMFPARRLKKSNDSPE